MELSQKYLEAYEAKDYQAMFYEAYSLIQRDGADSLLKYIASTDFFTAPASTRYHLACEGGLLAHSVHVWQRLRSLYMTEFGELDEKREETIAIVGLLHDVCKIGVYKTEMRNRKDERGKWIQVPVFTFDDPLPYGHGEKSVYIISGFMRLTREEAFSIRYHMGAWQEGEGRNAGKSFEMYPLSVLTHMADTMASYIDERETTLSPAKQA